MKPSCVDCVTELMAYTYHLADQLQVETVDYEQVLTGYQQLIERARTKAKAAGISKSLFDQALFPVFAWIDETLLATGWNQKNEWIRNSLQKKYFNTTNAGTEFFERIEKITESEKDLLEVYDYCLASGFKGSLYQPHQADALDGIKRATRKKVTGLEDEQIPDTLFPDAGDTLPCRRLKRKRWKGLADLTSVLVLLPVVLFFLLYYIFNLRLTQLVNNSGLLN
ncbi:DotU family type IV/VI secretion system protein [uncultured Desulfobacter sp.]|uniref:DotU family type IV/VI secretion system protein n=1 Tax=uncultured Desulfobacter sp. TaxID=240139 RepID=UPI002AAB1F7A|nr:DotU family type IV/VI secretion system protein [uncultured Desulfobacter sp.]